MGAMGEKVGNVFVVMPSRNCFTSTRTPPHRARNIVSYPPIIFLLPLSFVTSTTALHINIVSLSPHLILSFAVPFLFFILFSSFFPSLSRSRITKKPCCSYYTPPRLSLELRGGRDRSYTREQVSSRKQKQLQPKNEGDKTEKEKSRERESYTTKHGEREGTNSCTYRREHRERANRKGGH